MATQRVTIDFSIGRRGWTETYYLTNAPENPDDARAAAFTLIYSRQGLLPTYDVPAGAATLVGLRSYTVANVGSRRQAATFSQNLDPSGKNNKTNPIAPGGLRAAKITMYTAGKLQRRVLLLRGLPAAWVEQDINVVQAGFAKGGGQAALDNFVTRLRTDAGGGMRWALKHRPQTLAAGGSTITDVGVDGASNAWILHTNNLDIKPLTTIYVHGMRGQGMRGLNGKAMVVSNTMGALLLNKDIVSDCPVIVTSLGTIWTVGDPQYVLIAEARFSGWGEHRIGRDPVPQQKGRAAKCCGR